jgi:spore photoproduct lyase
MEVKEISLKSDFRPKRLFIQRSIEHLKETRDLIERLPELMPEVVDTEAEIHSILDGKVSGEALGKQYLYVAGNPNRFLKICPGLCPDLACCNLWVLNFAVGCNLDCSYCFLQTYLPYSLVTYFINLDDMLREVDELLEERQGQFVRVCTGELTDSLSLDHLVHFAPRLVEEFLNRERLHLELKTKTTNIENLRGIDPRGRVTLSWSLNSETSAQREEHHAASLEDRLAAAAIAESWGYRVGFHFDPIIHERGWEEGYQKTVDRIFESVRPDSLSWISLGALRFDPRLKAIAQRRFPSSRFVYGEFIPGPDSKMRYPEVLRVELFSKMHQWIRRHSPSVPVYLCMESYSVWQKAFGHAPASRDEVAGLLDDSVDI